MSKRLLMSMAVASSLLLVACQDDAPVEETTEVAVEQKPAKETTDVIEQVEETTTQVSVEEAAEEDAKINVVPPTEPAAQVEEPVSQTTTSLFTEYEQKLNATSASAERVYDNAMTTIEMEEAAQKAFALWDALLNEMYGVLKNELSAADFEELRADQREWIAERDDYATYQATEQANGGSAYTMLYIDAQAQYTAQRCSDFLYDFMVSL
ncbi:MAG: lysozyme inhibitor LprI family protein [Caryophanon sp.]|nr:lysozyme inhibitor LprI family protein [Caryophanon sp.]